MFRVRTWILFFAVAVCFWAIPGTVALAAELISSPAPGGDCCQSQDPERDAPCSGATGDCLCSCCPLPVLESPGFLIAHYISMTPGSLVLPSTLPFLADNSLEHPPKHF
jgi:hypothetical protein